MRGSLKDEIKTLDSVRFKVNFSSELISAAGSVMGAARLNLPVQGTVLRGDDLTGGWNLGQY